jgi:3-oxoadipate enol-lactonase
MPTLDVNGIGLYYEVAGRGAPLLFLHGLGSCTQDWEFQVPEFSKDYQVITFDLRGHGQSAKPRGPYSIEMLASDAAGLLRALGVQAAHVVGLSLGGAIAFQMAVSFPALTKTLVIVNSGPDAKLRTVRQKLLVATRIAMVRLLGLRRVGKALSTKLFPGPDLAGVRAAFMQRFVRNDRDCYLAALRALLGWSVSAQIGNITCPTLVVAADNDYTPVATKEAYVAKIPGAKLVIVPDSRHALPVEKPRLFNSALRAFLAEQSAPDEAFPSAHELPACRLIQGAQRAMSKQNLPHIPGISAESADAKALNLQLVMIPPGARAHAHKHEAHETAIYAVTGESGVWYGEHLEHHAVVMPGDFFYIPADVPHLPYNPSATETVVAVIARTDPNEQESVVLLPDLDGIHPH